jgi:hypothetical protein
MGGGLDVSSAAASVGGMVGRLGARTAVELAGLLAVSWAA